ncbi:M20/M25/M40 family metallo-hydrolase [Candidatus Riflebacteria bacterium]
MRTIKIAYLVVFLMFQTTTAFSKDFSQKEWDNFYKEAISMLQNYLRIDTSNPPGNEMKAARFFQDFFKKIGLEGQVFEVAPGRADFYLRLPGNGKKRPIILTNHMDVVQANASNWKHPPFSGKTVAAEIWGRGALDMKTGAIADAMLIKMVKISKKKLSRDLIFLGLADEESDGIGAEWFIKNRPELIEDAEYCLNEGATISIKNGRVDHYGVATMEKTVLWLELRTVGKAGHGSTPQPDSALDRMISALERLIKTPSPIVLTSSVESYFKTIARKAPAGLREKMKNLRKFLKDEEFIKELTKDPYNNALLKNTVAVTSVQSGKKVNIIPGEAKALLDCRLLPGTNRDEFLAWLKKSLADESIEIKENLYFPTEESPVNTELMQAIQTLAEKYDPGVPVVALPLTGTTDSTFFRRMGITTYGFEPVRLNQKQLLLQHGPNERISVENLKLHLRFKFQLINLLAK